LGSKQTKADLIEEVAKAKEETAHYIERLKEIYTRGREAKAKMMALDANILGIAAQVSLQDRLELMDELFQSPGV
jgi:hypothetical protein